MASSTDGAETGHGSQHKDVTAISSSESASRIQEDKWVGVGDEALRQELAGSGGADMSGTTIQQDMEPSVYYRTASPGCRSGDPEQLHC